MSGKDELLARVGRNDIKDSKTILTTLMWDRMGRNHNGVWNGR